MVRTTNSPRSDPTEQGQEMGKETYSERIKKLEGDPIWGHGKLEGELGPCKDATVYSSSKITTYQTCPRQYWHQYVNHDKATTRGSIKAARGSAVHDAAHAIAKHRKWGDWKDLYREAWNDVIEDLDAEDLPWSTPVTPESQMKIYDEGAAMLGQYVQRESTAPIWGTELPGRVVLQHPRTKTRYRFAFTLDRVDEAADVGWLIPDLKTGERAPSDAWLDRAVQFSVYGLGMGRGIVLRDEEPVVFDQYPALMYWYHLHNLIPYKRRGKRSDGSTFAPGDLRGDYKLPVHRTHEQYEQAVAEIFGIIRSIRMKSFPKQPGSTWSSPCNTCKFVHCCDTGSGPKEMNDTDLLSMEGL